MAKSLLGGAACRRPKSNPKSGTATRCPSQSKFLLDNPFLRLYRGNSLELLDAIHAKYPDGRFDAIFADPPYFLPAGP